jgi:recombination protein RecT
MTDAAAEAKALNPIVVLNSYLHDRIDSLRNALPPHIKPERFISSVMTAVQLNPDLLACERRSLFNACMRCAQDGLLPDGTEAAIVPYKAKAQYLAMYQGLLKKFRNSGQFKWIAANLVFEGDTFEHWIDQNGEHFKHVPADETESKKIRRVYAIATTKDGGSFIADLSLAEINKRRAMSRASRDDAPWKLWPDEMMKKTAIRVLSKLLPKSSDIDAFLQRDEDEALGVQATETISDQRTEAFGNVLDHFAEGAPSSAPPEGTVQSSAGESGGEQDAGAGLGQSARDPAVAEDPIALAYERGQQARAAGHARKAIPGEYRDSARTREALAWEAGHAGSELPTFPA